MCHVALPKWSVVIIFRTYSNRTCAVSRERMQRRARAWSGRETSYAPNSYKIATRMRKSEEFTELNPYLENATPTLPSISISQELGWEKPSNIQSQSQSCSCTMKARMRITVFLPLPHQACESPTKLLPWMIPTPQCVHPPINLPSLLLQVSRWLK